MKRKKTGFTLVELLTVLAIITLLIGLLVPSLATVRRLAKDTKQRAQLTTIGLALTAFRNDDGEYPRSDTHSDSTVDDYCGAQKLAEALLGWDLLGFHPDSAWRSDGLDRNGSIWTYDPFKARDIEPRGAPDGVPDTLTERRGLYLELGTSNAFRLGDSGQGDGLFVNTAPLKGNTYVICDAFGVREVTLPNGDIVRAGTPILYHRANTSSRIFAADNPASIYVYDDNARLLSLGMVANPRVAGGPPHPLYDVGAFQSYLKDPRASNPAAGLSWPYRPDSYILISAGADGRYGTSDDITNFGN